MPNAVLQINPQDRTAIVFGQKINDVLENGYSHAYNFDTAAGQSVGVGVWFVSTTTGQHVTKNIAVMDSSGKSAGNRCQLINKASPDTAVHFSCEIDQTGQWSVRVLGIEGESTGSYWVKVVRSR